MSGLFFVQDELKDSHNALFALFIALLFYNFYFLAAWVRLFVEVMIRLNIRQAQKNIFLKCCVKKLHIDDYEKNLKRERRRKRKEERCRFKNAPIANKSDSLIDSNISKHEG